MLLKISSFKSSFCLFSYAICSFNYLLSSSVFYELFSETNFKNLASISSNFTCHILTSLSCVEIIFLSVSFFFSIYYSFFLPSADSLSFSHRILFNFSFSSSSLLIFYYNFATCSK